MKIAARILATITALVAFAGTAADSPFGQGRFQWRASRPLIDLADGTNAPDPHVSIKDPTIVFAEDRWHLFATLRMKSGKVDIIYLNFAEWEKANEAPRHILAMHDQYYCAPQVFYFRPHKKWYLVYQLAEKTWKPPFGPCFSTSTNIADARSWSRPAQMVSNAPEKPKWLDFWVICDDAKAHLFYTSLDGNMWRRETKIADFPFGWTEQQLALRADIFEASHIYKLKGRNDYLTVIEAQGAGRRYYKAYLADRLEGPWRGLADSLSKPFASDANVLQPQQEWTTSISHGELLRAGIDERMEVNPEELRFLFQGASDAEYRQRYGAIPWRIGLLEAR